MVVTAMWACSQSPCSDGISDMSDGPGSGVVVIDPVSGMFGPFGFVPWRKICKNAETTFLFT